MRIAVWFCSFYSDTYYHIIITGETNTINTTMSLVAETTAIDNFVAVDTITVITIADCSIPAEDMVNIMLSFQSQWMYQLVAFWKSVLVMLISIISWKINVFDCQVM